MFFGKEIRVTRDLKECDRIRQRLEAAGIRYHVRAGTGALTNPGRDHGVPFINPSAEQYSIRVSRKDYQKALRLFQS